MSPASATRAAIAALVVGLAVALALGACGRKNDPVPPEGQESEYTYPQIYPAPSSVVPQEGEEPDPAAPEAAGESSSP